MMKSDNLKILFPIILAITSVAVSWGIMTTRIDAQEEKINKITEEYDKLGETLTQLRVDVAQIKTNVEFIKEKI